MSAGCKPRCCPRRADPQGVAEAAGYLRTPRLPHLQGDDFETTMLRLEFSINMFGIFFFFKKKKTGLLGLKWRRGSQTAACWGSERPAEGWGHLARMGQGTAGIKAHWTRCSPNWFSGCPPDRPFFHR